MILTKFQDFNQVSKFRWNIRILTKYHDFDQISGFLAQVIDSIPWVRCASGNVFSLSQSLVLTRTSTLLYSLKWREPTIRIRNSDSSDDSSDEMSRIWQIYPCTKKLEDWGKKSGRINSFAKSSIVLDKFEQLVWYSVFKPGLFDRIFSFLFHRSSLLWQISFLGAKFVAIYVLFFG